MAALHPIAHMGRAGSPSSYLLHSLQQVLLASVLFSAPITFCLPICKGSVNNLPATAPGATATEPLHLLPAKERTKGTVDSCSTHCLLQLLYKRSQAILFTPPPYTHTLGLVPFLSL